MGDKGVRSIRTAEYDVLLGLLKELRKESGLTQKELCLKLNQDLTFVSKIERGSRRLDLVELFSYAEALNQDPVQITQRYKSLLLPMKKTP